MKPQNACNCSLVFTARGAESAPWMGLGCRGQAGTHRIQINVGSDNRSQRTQRLPLPVGRLDDNAMIASLPKGSAARVAEIIPAGESLFDALHHLGKAAHSFAEWIKESGTFGRSANSGENGAELIHLTFAVNVLHAAENLGLVQGLAGRDAAGGNSDEEVKMVAHDTPSDEFEAPESRVAPGEFEELAAFVATENEPAVHHA